MEAFKQFFIDNWKIIVVVILYLLLLICSLLKKRVSSDLLDKIYLSVVNLVPGLISKFECPGNGESKKISVMTSAIVLIEKKLGRKLTDDEISFYSNKLSELIENILQTPQKKGE